MGQLIVLDGLDGSGKETQTLLLQKALEQSGRRVKMISFPMYDTVGATFVKEYLGGRFGEDPEAVNAYAASSASYGCNFYYFTPERIAWGRTKKTPINTADPLKTENMELMVSVVPQDGIYETICEQMWELRFDRLPSRLDANRGLYMDHSECYLIVTFEDGSSKTSSGYAITEINETYQKVTNLLSCYANKFLNDAKSNN